MGRSSSIQSAPPRGKSPQTQLRLRVTTAAESALRSGHPWVFSNSIREQNRAGAPGQLGVVYDRNNRFLAIGLFDPDSPLRLRVLHTGKPMPVNRQFFIERFQNAKAKRNGLFDSNTNGFRWINGESDGWPGLVLDRYADTVVLKLYTVSWLPWLEQLVEIILAAFGPQRIVLRLSRNIQESAARQFAKTDAQTLAGSTLDQPVLFSESGLRFEADVLRGQKTGFFLDQRENRRKVELLAKGRSVLNAFSFSGGFSVYAARGGARSVTDLDISAHALASSDRNFHLNSSIDPIHTCRRETIQADAFDWLGSNPRRKFDLIVLDPPSMARRQTDREEAIRAYSRLAVLGAGHLSPNGILVACSCSAHVSEQEFYHAIQSAVAKTKSRIFELQRTGQPADHPATFPEARYLKAIYLQF
ncbi:MAG TPA: class I SAM-dependent rRNA methyltransferase [Verrucomicrobiae bacterium]|nr:class I SAM-dependent rRNA methyltransferase [Verrucomicrobiae bacterium]